VGSGLTAGATHNPRRGGQSRVPGRRVGGLWGSLGGLLDLTGHLGGEVGLGVGEPLADLERHHLPHVDGTAADLRPLALEPLPHRPVALEEGLVQEGALVLTVRRHMHGDSAGGGLEGVPVGGGHGRHVRLERRQRHNGPVARRQRVVDVRGDDATADGPHAGDPPQRHVLT